MTDTRKRIAELEEAVRWIVESYERENFMRTADMHPDDCRCSRCAMDSAASLIEQKPPERTPEQKAAFDELLRMDGELYDVPVKETGDVERVARAIVSELVGQNEWKEMGAAEIQTACDAARAAIAAMRPSVDPVKLAEIRARHDYCAHVATKTEWEDQHAWMAHDDREWLLSALEGVNDDD